MNATAMTGIDFMTKSPYLKPLRNRIARSCLEVLAMEDIASSRLGLELFAALKSSARSVAATISQMGRLDAIARRKRLLAE